MLKKNPQRDMKGTPAFEQNAGVHGRKAPGAD
jgi:hypothetical protein